MTVLVTGGAGYIGSHVAAALLEQDREVVVVDDLSTGRRAAVPAGAAFVQGDAGDADLVRTLIDRHGVDAVVISPPPSPSANPSSGRSTATATTPWSRTA